MVQTVQKTMEIPQQQCIDKVVDDPVVHVPQVQSRVDEFSRRRLMDNQDTVNELTARIQGLQNEVNCLNDSRDFRKC